MSTDMTRPDLSADALAEAVATLRRGELVAFPTETVYGLGADASNEAAISKIFTAKARPADHPVIIRLADATELDAWGAALTPAIQALATRFWPGALTLIVPKHPNASMLLTGGQQSIGLRVPSHPMALQLLHAFGGAIAAPSANRFGHVSPTTAQHVRDEFAPNPPLILDGGACDIGIESTILDCTREPFTILRPGHISAGDLAEVLGYLPAIGGKDAPRASGTLESHYAPQTKARLLSTNALKAACRARPAERKIGVIAFSSEPGTAPLVMDAHDPQRYAHELYAMLRALDAQGLDEIWIETPPATSDWLAVTDRLRRACA